MFRYPKTFYCLSVFIGCAVHGYAQIPIPNIVRSQFMSAWNAITELSRAETVEDIDVHSIPYGTEILCRACWLTVDFLIASHNLNMPPQVTQTAMVSLCSLLQTRSMCQGMIDLNMPIFIEIAKRKPDLRPEHVCGTVFEQYCAESSIVDWFIQIPDPIQTSNERENTLSRRSYERQDMFEVLHVTDPHVDEQYRAGAVASGCREPLCCRGYQGPPTSSADAAGVWGDYHSCDIPWFTLVNMLDTLATNHKEIETVYMTGDLIAHNIWETNRENNIKQIQDQAALFYKILGKNVRIFPVLGNHEPHPANVLAPPEIEEYSGKWLYEAFYDSWCQHFPPETKATFVKGGYYSVSLKKDCRIIGLNSLFGYVFNWWMILDPVDPAGQLRWLVDTLLMAEAKREKVHILIHGPPAETDTLRAWKRAYSRILERFKLIIMGQFMGHTHRDQFYVHYDRQSNEPVAVAWNGGSVTPFTNVNPNYRVYSINRRTLEVEDFHTYAYNLTEANQTPNSPPNWFKLYSFKEAYKVPSLRPTDIHSLVKKMAYDDELFNKYFLYYMKNSDMAFVKGCNRMCQEKQLCKMVSRPDNSTECRNRLLN